MFLQPSKNRPNLGFFVRLPIFREVEIVGTGQFRESAAHPFRRFGKDLEGGGVLIGVVVGVFGGQPGFPDTAQAVNRLPGRDRRGRALVQRLM